VLKRPDDVFGDHLVIDQEIGEPTLVGVREQLLQLLDLGLAEFAVQRDPPPH
jgi:hypothetical protein